MTLVVVYRLKRPIGFFQTITILTIFILHWCEVLFKREI
jgi:hypothetical protein